MSDICRFCEDELPPLEVRLPPPVDDLCNDCVLVYFDKDTDNTPLSDEEREEALMKLEKEKNAEKKP